MAKAPGLADCTALGSDRISTLNISTLNVSTLNMPAIDFWFDFASTYSYPAARRIAPLAATAGVTVRFRPFLVGPIVETETDLSPSS